MSTYIVKGVARFANTFKPDKKYGKYQIAVTEMDAANVAALEESGLQSRTGKEKKEAWGKYRVFRSQYPMTKLVDAKLQPLPEDFFIPNGSRIAVKFKVKKYEGLAEPAAYVQTIQVIDLAEGQVDTDGFEVEDDGFTADELPQEQEFESIDEELI